MNAIINKSLTELVTETTAFASFEHMAAAMDSGYTPTLRPHEGSGRKQAQWNQMVNELARRLESMGYRVNRG